VRAAVLDEEGRLLGAARRPLAPRLGPGRAEQDPAAWLDALLASGREALDGRAEVDAVGVAALGPAPVLVDTAHAPLAPALLFSLDRRAEPQRVRLGTTHDHALPKLRWWQENEPGLWRAAALALDATGFLVARLTGIPAMDELTRGDWELDGHRAGIELPAPLWPTAIAGGLAAEPAAALGLRRDTPVAVGTYDTFADVAAAGVRVPGDAAILLGSTLIVCAAVPAAGPHEGLEASRYPGEGVLIGGWTASAGSVLDWAERELGVDVLDAAWLEPGGGGLVALPYFAGERTPVWDADARGVLLGLTLLTTRPQLGRALVDAVALSARDHLERLRSAGHDPAAWRAGGGGVRNEAWLRATADALGAVLEVHEHAGEAVGPAVLALRAAGADPVLATARLVRPDPGRRERFDRLYAVYRQLYPPLAPLMRALGELEQPA
jgi:xylulokinase